jgi:hypothetical protein
MNAYEVIWTFQPLRVPRDMRFSQGAVVIISTSIASPKHQDTQWAGHGHPQWLLPN